MQQLTKNSKPLKKVPNEIELLNKSIKIAKKEIIQWWDFLDECKKRIKKLSKFD